MQMHYIEISDNLTGAATAPAVATPFGKMSPILHIAFLLFSKKGTRVWKAKENIESGVRCFCSVSVYKKLGSEKVVFFQVQEVSQFCQFCPVLPVSVGFCTSSTAHTQTYTDSTHTPTHTKTKRDIECNSTNLETFNWIGIGLLGYYLNTFFQAKSDVTK